jgi:AcrR family transcriptional regulator
MPEPPKQARGIEKRDRLYEAAIARFERDGVAETRVEDVIADAEVSWATFFRYFPRKEDVLLEMGIEHFRTHVWPLGDETPEGPVRDPIYELLKALLISDWPSHLHGAVLREITSTPVRFSALLGDDEPPWFEILARLLAQGQEQGEVRDDVEAVTLAAVIGPACLFPAIQGGFEDLRSLRSLPGAGNPVAILDRTFPIAWRAVEP